MDIGLPSSMLSRLVSKIFINYNIFHFVSSNF